MSKTSLLGGPGSRIILARYALRRCPTANFSCNNRALCCPQRHGPRTGRLRQDDGVENPDGVPQPGKGQAVHRRRNRQPEGMYVTYIPRPTVRNTSSAGRNNTKSKTASKARHIYKAKGHSTVLLSGGQAEAGRQGRHAAERPGHTLTCLPRTYQSGLWSIKDTRMGRTRRPQGH